MKCICISCFDSYDIRMKEVINSFEASGLSVKYIVADFNHYSKKYNKNNIHTDNLVHVPAYRKNLSVRRVISHIVFSIKIRKIMIREKPDFVYCIIPPNSVIRSIAAYKKNNCNTYIILDFFDLWPESFPYRKHNPIMNTLFNIWRKERDKYIYCADKLILVSDEIKRMIDIGCFDSVVIPPAMSPDFIQKFNTDEENNIRFCYLGNINHITDTEMLIELLKKVSKYKKVILDIIGEGQNLSELVDKLTAESIEVVCHGIIFESNDKKEVFKNCSFGLNIPKKEVNVSMSLKSIEYMRTGLPYINTATGTNYEVIETYGAGINIERDNIEATALILAQMKEEDLRKMREACRKSYLRLFGPERIREEIMKAVCCR